LEHDGLDPCSVQQLTEQQTRRPGADNCNLRAHRSFLESSNRSHSKILARPRRCDSRNAQSHRASRSFGLTMRVTTPSAAGTRETTMPLKITLELNEQDLDYFRRVMNDVWR